MSDLTMRGVSKTFGHVSVLSDIDLEVKDREFVVLVGPSGCGKSTLLRLMAGLEDMTSGELTIDGVRMNDVSAAKRGLAMVFQSYALYPHMTVAQNMSVGLRIAGERKETITAKVAEAARILRLETLLDRLPRQLSGGQRQRVAIGRAIVRNPKVFLFDEPLSNLDAALRLQMRLELAKLRQQLNATMIYVTHDQVEAMTLADKIIVLNNGRIEQSGSPLDLYHRPRNLFVAGFIGSPKMNFLPGHIKANEGARAVIALDAGKTLAIEAKGLNPGDKVTVGIRPENVMIDSGDAASLDGSVSVVEHLGGQTVVYAQLPDGDQFTIQMDGGVEIKPGDRIRAGIPSNRVHLFSASGEVL